MRITRLRLQHFKRHDDLVIEPAAGLTVIRGPNESGKSTVQQALELALYRRVTASGTEIDELRPWAGSGDPGPEIELEFEDDGRRGRLVKAFRRAKGTVRLSIGDESTNDPATADHWLQELTGIPTEKFFRSTASIRHHEVDDLARDEGNLRDRLQASISGADRGVSVARKRLDDAIRALKAAGPKNPGPIKRAEDEVASLSDALRRGEEALAGLEQDRAQHVAAVARREETEVAVKATEGQLAQAELAIKLAAERAEAETRYGKYREAGEIRAQSAELERAHPSAMPLPILRTRVGRLQSLELEISECNADLAARDEDISDMEIPEPRWRPYFLAGRTLVAAGLAVLAALLVGQLVARPLAVGLVSIAFTVAVAAIAVSIPFLLFAWRRRDQARDMRRGIKQLRDKEVERRLRGRSEVAQKLRDAEIAKARILIELDRRDLAATQALLAAEEEHVRKLELLAARYGQLMRDDPRQDVEAARDEAAADAERKAAALAGMGELGREPERSREHITAQLKTLKDERDAAIREEASAAARVEQNPVDALEVAATSEALAVAEQRLATLGRRLRVLETTAELLDAAERATMKKATRFLEQRMARQVDRLTGGRYRRIQVDDDLGIRAWSPERRDWVPVSALSRGTLDQVYLAARVELVRLVTNDRRPPLVFDDPFVTYDDIRAAEAVALLRALSGEHQILYLTTSERYDAGADKVIVLPAPSERDRGAPAAAGAPAP